MLLYHSTTERAYTEILKQGRLLGQEWASRIPDSPIQANLTSDRAVSVKVTQFRKPRQKLVTIEFDLPEEFIARRSVISGYPSALEFSTSFTVPVDAIPESYLKNIPREREFSKYCVTRGELRFYELPLAYAT